MSTQYDNNKRRQKTQVDSFKYSETIIEKKIDKMKKLTKG